jgi:heterodisulfide reductase subunit B
MRPVAYYPGCTVDGTSREYGESIRAIAATIGLDLRELEDWTCCGASSAHVTNEELAFALPSRNLKIADKVGLDLLTPCAACFSRLKTAEKALRANKNGGSFKGNFHVKHLAEYIWEDIGEKPIKEKVVKQLTALNPVCYYGCLITRPPGVTGASNPENPESMDNIMRALGVDVKDWSYKTDCCGAGHSLTLPEVGHKLIQNLLDMALEAGVDSIVTACPMCQSNLDSYQMEISMASGKNYNTPIFYFTELMGIAFGNPKVEKWLSRHMVDPRPLLRQKGLL